MFSEFSYPMICAKDFAKTVSFYEDYFEFEPVFEMDDFTILKRKNWPDTFLAIIDSHHAVIPEQYRKSAAGVILNFPVRDSKEAYDALYLEGLNIISEPENAMCGRKHFFVEDPNGILIDVAENVPLEQIMSEEQMNKLLHVV